MRPIVLRFAAVSALLAASLAVPVSAQAANAAAAAVVAAQPGSVQQVAEGCGPHRHRVFRHHRSFCVHN